MPCGRDAHLTRLPASPDQKWCGCGTMCLTLGACRETGLGWGEFGV